MNLIYQFYEGELTSGNSAGIQMMKEYADRIGVKYIFEKNPVWPKEAKLPKQNLGRYNPHYGAFKFIFDETYDKYDNIMFCDCDVVPVEELTENVFDEFDSEKEIGICEEYMMPEIRSKYNIGGINTNNDNIYTQLCELSYNVKMPRDDKKRPRIFNSGMVVYSKKARQKAREIFPSFNEFVKLMSQYLPMFYQGDQNYLNAMLPKFNWQLMDYKWNSQIFYKPETKGDNRPILDYRNNPNFVHVQLRGADNYSFERLKKVVNS